MMFDAEYAAAAAAAPAMSALAILAADGRVRVGSTFVKATGASVTAFIVHAARSGELGRTLLAALDEQHVDEWLSADGSTNRTVTGRLGAAWVSVFGDVDFWPEPVDDRAQDDDESQRSRLVVIPGPDAPATPRPRDPHALGELLAALRPRGCAA